MNLIRKYSILGGGGGGGTNGGGRIRKGERRKGAKGD